VIRVIRALLAVVTMCVALVFVSEAGALTLGSTVPAASGSMPGYCPVDETPSTFADDPSVPYIVPAGGGEITGWSTNTTEDTAGAQLTLVVLRKYINNIAPPAATVVGVDPETLPAVLPADGVVSYQLATPIDVTGGDVLGLYSSNAGSSSDPVCYWSGPPAAGALVAWYEPSEPSTPPYTGEGLISDEAFGPAKDGADMNLAANLVLAEDVNVRTSAAATATRSGDVVLVVSTVTNSGPRQDPITFTDSVPKGLAIRLVESGSGTCATHIRQVTCTIRGLAAGQSEPIYILAKPTKTGRFRNAVSVTPQAGDTDPNPANNNASAAFIVRGAPGAPRCLVPKLRGLKRTFAVQALRLLGCRPAVKHEHSAGVARGRDIATKPTDGVYAAEKRIVLDISSGP
jgi:Domain of unknown function DUF11